jgi:putative transposase
MIFDKGYLYHIYNQGNNKQKIFYGRGNYLFFLKKINEYILPYADILAWCLMPNHFHLMVLIKEVESQGFVQSEALTKIPRSQTITTRTINDSIGILLRTYTRAINKQKGVTGSLFRKETKAECINCFRGGRPTFIRKNILINNHLPKKQYPQICFNYIHLNPVKAKLTKKATDWEFSSSRDYEGLRKSLLINKEVSKEYVEF